MVAPPVTITDPSAPRVTTAVATLAARPFSASSKLCVWNRAMASASLAKTMSAFASMKPSRASRWRSTTKASDRVMAVSRPASRAAAAAVAKASRAAGEVNR